MEEAKRIKLGNLENAYRIVAPDGREAVTVTTPSMWALADDFADGLRLSGRHSELWILRRMTFAIQMQAAQAEGLHPDGPITLERIIEFVNLCKVDNVPAERIHSDEEPSDPTRAAPAGAPGAA
ncbi:hypothetical protein [Eggerthella sinensis]|uniref:Uncharacterized protein n=1 Tax=Eggerthella sinensis TaxID=242230 RepID=A0A3N0IV18_9ACTN|nr:hypothetical protein [Eggerthella sinensis]RDB70677.1 hypothetical protein C1876_02895 [Eggerthella sinensis]RNM40785.1 hypothetical protein DMP09_12830 [Eggerthella sinensis]